MLHDIANTPTECQILLSATEWADPETRIFKELLWNMSDEEFEALEADLERMDETGETTRCIKWLEGYFAREIDMPLAA